MFLFVLLMLKINMYEKFQYLSKGLFFFLYGSKCSLSLFVILGLRISFIRLKICPASGRECSLWDFVLANLNSFNTLKFNLFHVWM